MAVIDASIVIASFSPDEALAGAVDAIKPYLLGGGNAPALLPYEIANALHWKVRRGGLSRMSADEVLNGILLVPVALHASSAQEVAAHTVPLSWKHGLTIYDAAYLELALRLTLPLATVDKALVRAARQEGVTILGPL